jgi:HPt (histidine-containing phosphotransfer) domain-containing protein
MFRGALSRLAQMGGQELAIELLDRFLIEGPERLEMARTALAAQDSYELQQHLHRLCSDAGWLGAKEIQLLAGEGEIMAEKGEMEKLSAVLDELSQLCYQTCMSLEQEKARMLEPSLEVEPKRPSAETSPEP